MKMHVSRIGKSSSLPGVFYVRLFKKYSAKFEVEGIMFFLGMFDTELDAGNAIVTFSKDLAINSN